MRLALIVEYEGTAYHGFQSQANAPSIQEEIEKAIGNLTGELVRVKGAGRTDAGVHARGQVVAFDTESEHSPETFVKAMNHYLPEDIAVRQAHRVRDDFDPRRHAVSRTYRYTVVRSPTPSPLMQRQACMVDEALDVPSMRGAARMLEGEHDFRRFAGPLEREGASTIRRIDAASIIEDGNILKFDFVGNAFLPHQVRRMAGALLDVGRGRIKISDFEKIVAGKCGEAVAHSLPPQGLCLMKVTYPDFPPKVGD